MVGNLVHLDQKFNRCGTWHLFFVCNSMAKAGGSKNSDVDLNRLISCYYASVGFYKITSIIFLSGNKSVDILIPT